MKLSHHKNQPKSPNVSVNGIDKAAQHAVACHKDGGNLQQQTTERPTEVVINLCSQGISAGGGEHKNSDP